MSEGGNKSIQITERDLSILSTLLECRLLTRKQAATLHFDGHQEAAKKRLSALKGAGYISCSKRLIDEPAIFTLRRLGFELLRSRGYARPSKHPWERLRRSAIRPAMIAHEVAVMDVRCALVDAVKRQQRLKILAASTTPIQNAFSARDGSGLAVQVQPDAFLHLVEARRNEIMRQHFFYVEVDRSTETLQRLVQRMCCYWEHYQSGGLAKRFGRSGDEFKLFPFRVLIICRSAERWRNLAAALRLAKVGGLGMFWLTTIDEAVQDLFGRIWTLSRPSAQVKPFDENDHGMEKVEDMRMVNTSLFPDLAD